MHTRENDAVNGRDAIPEMRAGRFRIGTGGRDARNRLLMRRRFVVSIHPAVTHCFPLSKPELSERLARNLAPPIRAPG